MNNLIYDKENKERNNVYVVMSPNTENYVQHYFAPLYLDRLMNYPDASIRGIKTISIG